MSVKDSEANFSQTKIKEKPIALVKGKIDDFIVYENKNLVVLNKPPGLPSQQGTGIKQASVDQLLNKYLGDQPGYLVHRLD